MGRSQLPKFSTVSLMFTTRAPVPDILGEDGRPLYQGKPFEPGKDYIVREAPPGGGYVVAVGETVYRALDAVIRLQERGAKVGLVNKATVNVVDKDMKAQIRPVTVLYQDEVIAALGSGVVAGERVVTDGQLRITPGITVAITQPAGEQPAAQGRSQSSSGSEKSSAQGTVAKSPRPQGVDAEATGGQDGAGQGAGRRGG